MTAVQVFRRLMCALWLVGLGVPAHAQALRVVAIGASNTSGWGVASGAAYPERLQALLRAQGLDAKVTNAGISFQTTHGMLRRIDSIPAGTQVVIIQPGGNDIRFLGSHQTRTANVNAMAARVEARGMKAIVYDPVFARGDYQWDGIHLTAATHSRIAAALLPQVLAAAGKRR